MKEYKTLKIKDTSDIQMETLIMLMELAKKGWRIYGMRGGETCEIYLEKINKDA